MNVAKAETTVGIDIGLNPKYQYNGSLVAKLRIGEGQTIISEESRTASDWRKKWVAPNES